MNKTLKKTLVMTVKVTALTLAFFLNACSGGDQPNVELLQDMMESPAIKAQEFEANAPQHRGMRVPPEHTVPVGFKPYKYGTDYEGATKNKNPFAGQVTSDVLVSGQKYFSIHCAVCHGDKGLGDGLVAPKLVAKAPPSLMSDKVRNWTDGQIYHVIQVGQGMMGSYGPHLPKEEMKWAVVSYIRSLQTPSQH